jgi:hypothetical protein
MNILKVKILKNDNIAHLRQEANLKETKFSKKRKQVN